MQCATGSSFPGVKWPGREAENSVPTDDEVNKTFICTSTALSLHVVVLNLLSSETTLPLHLPLDSITDRLCGLAVRVPSYRSRGPGSDSRRYQIFWEVVGLERGPLSLLSTTEELLERESSLTGLETWDYDRRDPSRWPRDTLCPQNLVLTLATRGGRYVGIVRSRTQVTVFRLVFLGSITDINYDF
jgi:hypothetical protein